MSSLLFLPKISSNLSLSVLISYVLIKKQTCIGECLGERTNFGRWGFRFSKRDTCVRETQKTVIPKRFAKYPYNSPENIREQFGREMRFSLHILIRFFVKLHPHTGKRLQIWSNFFLRLVDTPSLYPVKIFGAVIIFRYSKHSHTNWHFG